MWIGWQNGEHEQISHETIPFCFRIWDHTFLTAGCECTASTDKPCYIISGSLKPPVQGSVFEIRVYAKDGSWFSDWKHRLPDGDSTSATVRICDAEEEREWWPWVQWTTKNNSKVTIEAMDS
eukprot:Hpha_TRINITY_DN4554_c0_g1::TRINITY_DN4554_c0_g1_i1::g.115435::m.115435